MKDMEKRCEDVFLYHESTKHHFQEYAKSAGYMDWKNQPIQFRLFENAEHIALPFLKDDPECGFHEMFSDPGSEPELFSLYSIGGFLELSMAISAWKATADTKWPLRINPSSGNLHPSEAHIVIPSQDDAISGIHHYSPLFHVLEKRAEIPETAQRAITTHFKMDVILVALTGIPWREAWKYGERAYRYCNLDAGHALACFRFAARLFGWKLTYLDGVSDKEIRILLGLDKTEWEPLEDEIPELICALHTSQDLEAIPRNFPDDVIREFEKIPFSGRPNPLSRERREWKIIYETAKAAQKDKTAPEVFQQGTYGFFPPEDRNETAADIIRKRRSGTAYDPGGTISKNAFFQILDKTLPREKHPPFDVQIGVPAIDLVLFIHCVKKMVPGLFYLIRTGESPEIIRTEFRSDFLWEKVTPDFPLYCLAEGDYSGIASRLSCGQSIAGDGVFSLGMLSRFSGIISHYPWKYKTLLWEAGMIGQVLYLGAEASGIRGTGIGCYFDDPVHELLGLSGNSRQILYHFAMGLPFEDQRLTTLDPYHHLKNGRIRG